MASMFCRNCGKDLEPNSKFCISCGVAPPKGNSYCQNCGSGVSSLAEVCVKCGVSLARVSAKSKTVSVILAVILSFWTWLYTYKRDGKKFWIAISASIFLSVLFYSIFFLSGHTLTSTTFIYAESEFSTIMFAGMILAQLTSFAIRVWAIIDTAVKPQYWYDHY